MTAKQSALSIRGIVDRFLTSTPPLASAEVLVPEPLLRDSPHLSALSSPLLTTKSRTASANGRRRTDTNGSTDSAASAATAATPTTSSVAAAIDADLRKLSKVATAFRENYIWNEIRAMDKLAPSGVYVAPRFDNISEWDGVLFAAAGLYAGGAFRFRLLLDATYPESVPRVLFVVPPFHPYIDADGWLQTHRAVAKWVVNETYIHHIFMYMKRILLHVQTDDDASNVDASFYFTKNYEEFERRARQSVTAARAACTSAVPAHLRSPVPYRDPDESTSPLSDDDPDPNDPLKMTEVSDGVVTKIVDRMRKYVVKVAKTEEDRDVDLWLPDFLEDLEETVQQR